MLKKFLGSPIATVALFVAAAALIGYGGIKGVQAAPRVQSELFGVQVELDHIQTSLTENGQIAEGDGDLLGQRFFDANDDLSDASQFKVGKAYNEVLAVQNTGTIDQYVRVTVRKYWYEEEQGADGVAKKRVNLDPSLINLHFVTDDGWVIDEKASTPERTVLYYQGIVGSEQDSESGEPSSTSPFVDKITISSDVLTQTTDKNLDYENLRFCVEAEVDAVQTHNGDEAMRGVWGRTVEGY
ncbi:MAG: hypothetical protein IKG11_00185 [Atopobiaceae bacterium]|nr:hypothetical protein [Atopobiaceae bacterium]MDO4403838.1 hypothetical protein [Atopobiaceae bacterium]